VILSPAQLSGNRLIDRMFTSQSAVLLLYRGAVYEFYQIPMSGGGSYDSLITVEHFEAVKDNYILKIVQEMLPRYLREECAIGSRAKLNYITTLLAGAIQHRFLQKSPSHNARKSGIGLPLSVRQDAEFHIERLQEFENQLKQFFIRFISEGYDSALDLDPEIPICIENGEILSQFKIRECELSSLLDNIYQNPFFNKRLKQYQVKTIIDNDPMMVVQVKKMRSLVRRLKSKLSGAENRESIHAYKEAFIAEINKLIEEASHQAASTLDFVSMGKSILKHMGKSNRYHNRSRQHFTAGQYEVFFKNNTLIVGRHSGRYILRTLIPDGIIDNYYLFEDVLTGIKLCETEFYRLYEGNPITCAIAFGPYQHPFLRELFIKDDDTDIHENDKDRDRRVSDQPLCIASQFRLNRNFSMVDRIIFSVETACDVLLRGGVDRTINPYHRLYDRTSFAQQSRSEEYIRKQYSDVPVFDFIMSG
jgi:hypothetical protein